LGTDYKRQFWMWNSSDSCIQNTVLKPNGTKYVDKNYVLFTYNKAAIFVSLACTRLNKKVKGLFF
jgi:hypothetical protein